jgi:hypothetical protein
MPTPTPTPTPTATPSPTPTPTPTPPPVDPVENAEDHEDPTDYVWDTGDIIDIELNDTLITVNAVGVATVNGSKVTIMSAGNYRINGSLTDGQVIVNTDDEETVRLILNGVNIHCNTSSPVYIEDAKKVILVLQEDTENHVSDGISYNLEPDTDEPNAAVFSKTDLTIFGNGSLSVEANYNDGIVSKDGFIIKSGNINVSSVDDGIRGKDYLVVKGGNITLNVGGDGLKSDNADDLTMGYISVETGKLNITCGGDAVQATTDVIIFDGEVNLTSGGGSNVTSEGSSTKGVKAGVSIVIDNGTLVVDSADDAFHSNKRMTINGGSFLVSTGDDGFHADIYLEINGGTINITKCYEGLESAVITINNGTIHLIASDDGINVASDGDGNNPWTPYDNVTYTGDQFLYINGGYIHVDSSGDGVDVNGEIVMNDGVLIVNGPPSGLDAAFDRITFKMNGGFMIAAGNSLIAEGPSTSSTQYTVMVRYFIMDPKTFPGDTLFHIRTIEGEEVVTFAPAKQYSSVVFSSPELTLGTTYEIYVGGNTTGTTKNGVYTNGTYTPGTYYRNFTISNIITVVPTFPL